MRGPFDYDPLGFMAYRDGDYSTAVAPAKEQPPAQPPSQPRFQSWKDMQACELTQFLDFCMEKIRAI